MSTTPFQIHGLAHTGITVRSLPQTLSFWHDLLHLPILSQRTLSGPVASAIVRVENITAHQAILQLPDGSQLEFLEYTSPQDRKEVLTRPCDVGNVHVALNVGGVEDLVEKAKGLGWEAGELQRFTRGDGREWVMGFLTSGDGVTVEVMEKLEE